MDDQSLSALISARPDTKQERSSRCKSSRSSSRQSLIGDWCFESISKLRKTSPINQLIGGSHIMMGLRARIIRYAETKETVLISGETGTGKELIARLLHDLSTRQHHPFVAVNCAAIPAQLAESELFGNTRGAYTGAINCRNGLLSRANGGTLFLDEFGELAPEVQSKLLRVLELGSYRPVGSTREQKTDVRILAATNRNLEKSVLRGEFRADLYYRINVLHIVAPPLRAHRCDIPQIVGAILGELLSEGSKVRVKESAMTDLLHAPWPGNVRELKNVLRRALVMSTGGVIESIEQSPHLSGVDSQNKLNPFQSTGKLIDALVRNHGRLAAVANELSVSVRTVQRRIKENGLCLRDFRRI